MLSAYITHPDAPATKWARTTPSAPSGWARSTTCCLTKGLLDDMAPYDAEPATVDKLDARARCAVCAGADRRLAHRGLPPRRPQHQHEPAHAAGRAARGRRRGAGHRPGAGRQGPLGLLQHCAPRPPCRTRLGAGLLLFNNVAVGIRHALDVHGLQRVALIDFDVHHANGSEDILMGDERVLMCSIYEKGLFPDSGESHDGPNMVNVGLPARVGSDAFREAVLEQWLPALDAFAPQLIYISAGFDAHREDDMGNLALVEADYAWVTQQIMRLADRHCRGRVISCLEGGYALSALARSTAAHVRSLIRRRLTHGPAFPHPPVRPHLGCHLCRPVRRPRTADRTSPTTAPRLAGAALHRHLPLHRHPCHQRHPGRPGLGQGRPGDHRAALRRHRAGHRTGQPHGLRQP